MKTFARFILFLGANLMAGGGAIAAEPAPDWPTVTLLSPREVHLSGPIGQALDRGVARLGKEPFTADWLLADVSFKVNRIFTNYSGDASGRFIELAALTTPRGQLEPPALGPVLAAIASHQKSDGHFGLTMDLAQPLVKLAPPIPMLWGNARLLVALVTAAQEFQDPKLLAAAKRLGDFYVASSAQLCSPAREAEYRASGTYGDGYTCCYFPAIEGLATLYRATQDKRYLDQARRMADFFRKFDVLPVDHSHGNLCAWRGILELFAITGDHAYLDGALAKWEAAVQGGYVWPGGGIGEHWQVFFQGDEGCSESDWLRFNLELWRFTGDTRCLDLAERLLANQYPANQCPNGGYGWRHYEGDAAGPIATRGPVEEWPFCCSFHGPLGLHYLKAYLAASSERGLFINFPFDYSATLKASGREWRLRVRTKQESRRGDEISEVELAPQDALGKARATLWLRVPQWASRVAIETAARTPLRAPIERGYLRLEREFSAGEKIIVRYQTRLAIEARRFQPIQPEPGRISRLSDVTLLSGPRVLFALSAPASGRLALLATINAAGGIEWPGKDQGARATVALPDLNAPDADIVAALESARLVALKPWSEIQTRPRAAFAQNLVVAPADLLPETARARFAERVKQAALSMSGPFFGAHLEARPEVWVGAGGWQFTPETLRVSGGDVGLMAGEGYDNYRFEFELELPREGQGISGWVVRAQDENDCLMFQLQSADSPYHAPEFKTKPNTLRPHVRRNGAWQIADPIPLPKEIRRGESHRIAMECRADKIDVFLDGKKIHSQTDGGLRAGAVGFRASGAAEAGLLRNITLQKLSP